MCRACREISDLGPIGCVRPIGYPESIDGTRLLQTDRARALLVDIWDELELPGASPAHPFRNFRNWRTLRRTKIRGRDAMSAESVEPMTAGIDTRDAAKVLDFIKAHEARRDAAPVLFLAGADADDRVELTTQVNDLLKQIVQALADGRSVDVLAHDQEISTQQAADILGLSRPTVVRLIDEGELPATVPGAVRRRLRLTDVLAYRDELYERRSAFIAESSEEFEDIDPDDAAAVLAELRGERPAR